MIDIWFNLPKYTVFLNVFCQTYYFSFLSLEKANKNAYICHTHYVNNLKNVQI